MRAVPAVTTTCASGQPSGTAAAQPAFGLTAGEAPWDAWAQAPYLWNAEKQLFVTYDDPQSLSVKSRYIREHGLGGAMFWEYTEDPTGALLGALFDGLRR